MPYKNPEDKRRQGTKWMLEWRRAHPEEARRKTRDHLRRWRPKNRDRIKKYNERTEGYRKSWRKRNPEKVRQYQRKRADDVKRYLGGKCYCCGIKEFEFLTVDHIHNDGWKERKKINGRYGKNNAYYQAIVVAFRSGKKREIARIKRRYRLACFNCNAARAYYGKCPHDR